MTSIDTDDVSGLIAGMREAGLSGSSVRLALLPLSLSLAHAARRGVIASNPLLRLERGERPAKGHREMRVLDKAEIAALLDGASGRYRVLIALSVATGLRQGEALGSRWHDVDFGAGTLRVRFQLDGDGGLVEPKTVRARREVVLSRTLVAMLREHKAASAFSQPGDFVFCSLAGTPLKHRSVVRVELDKAASHAGLDGGGLPHLRWHDLRHTAASLLIAGGASIAFVSAQLGHANAATTLNTYTHLWDAAEHGERARAAMDAALGNPLET